MESITPEEFEKVGMDDIIKNEKQHVQIARTIQLSAFGLALLAAALDLLVPIRSRPVLIGIRFILITLAFILIVY